MSEIECEIELVCQNCDYHWIYTGKLLRATCPSCGAKVPVEENKVEEEEEE